MNVTRATLADGKYFLYIPLKVCSPSETPTVPISPMMLLELSVPKAVLLRFNKLPRRIKQNIYHQSLETLVWTHWGTLLPVVSLLTFYRKLKIRPSGRVLRKLEQCRWSMVIEPEGHYVRFEGKLGQTGLKTCSHHVAAVTAVYLVCRMTLTCPEFTTKHARAQVAPFVSSPEWTRTGCETSNNQDCPGDLLSNLRHGGLFIYLFYLLDSREESKNIRVQSMKSSWTSYWTKTVLHHKMWRKNKQTVFKEESHQQVRLSIKV